MLFSHYDRYRYVASPLFEVICQLRFPSILKINASDPVDFQEQMRLKYPRYAAKQEQPAPPPPQAGKPAVAGPAIINHNFISEDGTWKINLTKDFIALSTVRYQTWEDFAARLDEVLAEFIQIYRPAFFERVGLRYINAFSKKRLHLEDKLWDDLIEAPFIGILGEADVDESKAGKSVVDAELDLENNVHLHLHTGLGKLNAQKEDKEVKYILDHDYSVKSKVHAPEVPEKLLDMHDYAVRLFRAVVSDELHNAMGPSPL